jgi:hypothetical protein
MWVCKEHNLIFETSLSYASHCRRCEFYKPTYVICKVCKERFRVKPSQLKIGQGIYCSNRCFDKDKKFIENSGRYKIGDLRLKKYNEKNNAWKGDLVGRTALHNWVRRRLIKPKFCVKCGKKKPYDLANKSGTYKRDLNDWWWLCRTCHMNKDGRMVRLHTKCPNCGKGLATIHPLLGVMACKKCLLRMRQITKPSITAEVTTNQILEDRKIFKSDLLQPFRDGHLSKEFVKAYPEKTKQMIEEGNITESDIDNMQNVWTENEYYKED